MNMDMVIAITGIETARTEIVRLTKLVQDWIKTDAPLEDRWAAYLKIEPYLESSGCSFSLDSAEEDMGCGELTYYDDLNMDRYVCKSLSHILETLQDNVLQESAEYKAAEKAEAKRLGVDYMFQCKDKEYMKAWLTENRLKFGCKFEKFRNEIMASGYGGTENDW